MIPKKPDMAAAIVPYPANPERAPVWPNRQLDNITIEGFTSRNVA